MRHEMFVDLETLLELELVVHRLADLVRLIHLSGVRTNLTEINGHIRGRIGVIRRSTAAHPDATRHSTIAIRTCVVEDVQAESECHHWLVVQVTRDLNLRYPHEILDCNECKHHSTNQTNFSV